MGHADEAEERGYRRGAAQAAAHIARRLRALPTQLKACEFAEDMAAALGDLRRDPMPAPRLLDAAEAMIAEWGP